MDERENWEFVAYSDKLEKYGCMDAAIRPARGGLWILGRKRRFLGIVRLKLLNHDFLAVP